MSRGNAHSISLISDVFSGTCSVSLIFHVTFSLEEKKKIETVSVSRIDGKFTCPKCSSKLNSPTTLNRQLGKMHDGRCSTSSIRKKRLRSEVDNNDNNIVNANDNSNSNNNSLSIILN